MANDSPEISHGVKRIYQRFARWRSAHPGVRLPIPPRLWKAAAKVAHEHGVCRTVQVLRLEYGKLKRMAESDRVPVTVTSHKGRGIRRSAASLPAGAKLSVPKGSRGRSTAALPRAGLAHARQNGKRLGRPATIAVHVDRIRKLHRSGFSKSAIARRLHIGRTSVRRILHERNRS